MQRFVKCSIVVYSFSIIHDNYTIYIYYIHVHEGQTIQLFNIVQRGI